MSRIRRNPNRYEGVRPDRSSPGGAACRD